MNLNFSLYYKRILPKLSTMLFYRPLMIVTVDMYKSEEFKRRFESGDREGAFKLGGRIPLQLTLEEEIPGWVDTYNPVEVHISVTRFFESSFKHIYIDLDASPAIGLMTVFDYAKGLSEYVLKKEGVQSLRMVFTGNRGFHFHVELSKRLSTEEVTGFMQEVQEYKEPFIGKIDMGVNVPNHSIRLPYSYNLKGNKFAFYVDKLNEFSEDIAQDWSDHLYKGVMGE